MAGSGSGTYVRPARKRKATALIVSDTETIQKRLQDVYDRIGSPDTIEQDDEDASALVEDFCQDFDKSPEDLMVTLMRTCFCLTACISGIASYICHCVNP
jgi:hypothetical protein